MQNYQTSVITSKQKTLSDIGILSLRGSTASAVRPRQSRMLEKNSELRLLRRFTPRNDAELFVAVIRQLPDNARSSRHSESASWRTKNLRLSGDRGLDADPAVSGGNATATEGTNFLWRSGQESGIEE